MKFEYKRYLKANKVNEFKNFNWLAKWWQMPRNQQETVVSKNFDLQSKSNTCFFK